jgi:hypothetical protein
VRYEDYCAQPLETVRWVADFAALERALAFERQVGSMRITDMTNRYRKDLSPEQVVMLSTLLRSDLLRYGYDVSDADLNERGRPSRPERSYQLTGRRSG